VNEKKTINLVSSASFLTAQAASANPNLGWLEFVLTDALPNSNKQGINASAFDSLVNTGMFMPVKMAAGKINLDHSEAEPLGAIASLVADETKILGKAALWKQERQTDYEMLVSLSASSKPIDISWEIAYTESKVDDEGVEWIADPILTGAAIVGLPAYSGRTPVTAVASTEVNEDSPPDPTHVESGGDDELETEDDPIKLLEATITKLESEMDEQEKELVELREYKVEREKKDAEAALFAERTKGIADAGLTVSTEEIEAKKDFWLSLSDESFGTMLSMMKELKPASASASLPDVSGSATVSTLDIVRAGLAEMRTKTLEE